MLGSPQCWALLNERPDLPFNCANLLFEVANMFV